jgi:hypothetical protein
VYILEEQPEIYHSFICFLTLWSLKLKSGFHFFENALLLYWKAKSIWFGSLNRERWNPEDNEKCSGYFGSKIQTNILLDLVADGTVYGILSFRNSVWSRCLVFGDVVIKIHFYFTVTRNSFWRKMLYHGLIFLVIKEEMYKHVFKRNFITLHISKPQILFNMNSRISSGCFIL